MEMSSLESDEDFHGSRTWKSTSILNTAVKHKADTGLKGKSQVPADLSLAVGKISIYFSQEQIYKAAMQHANYVEVFNKNYVFSFILYIWK